MAFRRSPILTSSSALPRFAEDGFESEISLTARRNAVRRAPVARPTPMEDTPPPAPLWQPGTYGAAQQQDQARAALGALIAVGALASAILWMNVAPMLAPHRTQLVSVDLSVTPPPSAPQPKTKAQPTADQVSAPQPQTATQAPQTTPAPIAAALPVSSAQAAPAPAAPAPAPAPAPVAAAAPAPAGPPAAPAGPAEGGDLSSRMLSYTVPTYPIDSRRLREEGVVVLSLLLGTDGKVAEISVSKSSGHDRLDEAALSAVRKWRWKPTLRDGQPVLVRGLVRIPFILKH